MVVEDVIGQGCLILIRQSLSEPVIVFPVLAPHWITGLGLLLHAPSSFTFAPSVWLSFIYLFI
jgi:hypothetical protein